MRAHRKIQTVRTQHQIKEIRKMLSKLTERKAVILVCVCLCVCEIEREREREREERYNYKHKDRQIKKRGREERM